MFSVSVEETGTREMVAFQVSESSWDTTSMVFSVKVMVALPLPGME